MISVARLHSAGDIRLHTESAPDPGRGEVLLEVNAVGICGSDLHWYTSASIGETYLRDPLVLGHEFSATVASGPLRGQRVFADPAIPCQQCYLCLGGQAHLCRSGLFAGHPPTDGALREQMAWPEQNMHPLPDWCSATDGAMIEPLAVALHAMRLGTAHSARSIAVVGCGPIGLMLVQLAVHAGAQAVIAVEPLEHRRAAAERFGATVALAPQLGEAAAEVLEVTNGRGASLTFEASGEPGAVETAVSATEPGGRVVLVGIPSDDRTSFSASEARRKELTIHLCRRSNGLHDRALDLLRRKDVDVGALVTGRYDLEQVTSAFEAASRRIGLKVMVERNRDG